MSGTRAGGAAAPSSDLVGKRIGGRFELGRELGAGGMGTVHEALDVTMGRRVAIKLLRAELARDQHQLRRFEREAKAAAKLSHPNVVGVTELVKDDAVGLGLVMELLEGESLASRLDRGPLTEHEAVTIFMQALDGLTAAHSAGMVHRDLKPSNVFLVPLAGGVLVKLLDFGIVKLAEDGAALKLTRKGALIGTPTYMSPEQVACDPVDARSDVYSMGACLYEALVARPPYEEPHSLALIAAVGAGPPRDLHEIDRAVSPDLVHVVRVAMARDRSARYQTAAAMREALRGAVVADGPRPTVAPTTPVVLSETKTAAAFAPPPTPTPVPPTRRRPLALALASVVVGIALAATLLYSALHRAPVSSGPASPVAPRPTITAPIVPPPVAPPPVAPPVAPATPSPPRLPIGIEPPPEAPPSSVASPSVPPSSIVRSRPPPHHGRVGEDVLDPFEP